MLDHLHDKNVVRVTRLDRLARSTKDLVDIAERLNEAEAGLRSLAEPWADTTSPAGRMVLTVFAGLTEFERSSARSSTSALAAGGSLSWPKACGSAGHPNLTTDQISLGERLVSEGTSVREAVKLLKCHYATLYRALSASAV